MNYWEYIDKIIEATPKYAHLPLPELLMTVGTECGYYSQEKLQTMLNNVYINDVVKLPDVAGYFEWNGEYWFWMTNERNQLFTEKFKNATDMVLSFIMTANNNAKSPYDKVGFHISVEEFVNSEGLK